MAKATSGLAMRSPRRPEDLHRPLPASWSAHQQIHGVLRPRPCCGAGGQNLLGCGKRASGYAAHLKGSRGVRPLFQVIWEAGLRRITFLRPQSPLNFKKEAERRFASRNGAKEGFERWI